MKVIARKDNLDDVVLDEVAKIETPELLYTDVVRNVKKYRNFCKTHEFLCDAYPSLDVNLGAGSMALYLGGEPKFAWDTVWFVENIDDIETAPDFKFDPNNPWFVRHIDMIREALQLSGGDFLVNIPDIIENIDVLSSLRGPQNMCYDLIDYPETVHKLLGQIERLYFKYYDAFYDIVKDPSGASSFTAFSIWGKGRTGKVQCDFNAMMSPNQFREFVLPSVVSQCNTLTNSIFHVDGPDASRHVDALCEVGSLNTIQWTHGAGKPDGLDECWFKPIYEKADKAHKSTLSFIEYGDVSDWIRRTDKLVNKFGTRGLYLQYPVMSMADAEKLITYADKEWK